MNQRFSGLLVQVLMQKKEGKVKVPLSMEFSRPEYWSGQPFPSPGDLPNSGIEIGSPTLQVDSLPAEPPEKPKNPGLGSLSLSPGNLPDPGIKLGSPALQEDSLPTELSGKPRKKKGRGEKYSSQLASYESCCHFFFLSSEKGKNMGVRSTKSPHLTENDSSIGYTILREYTVTSPAQHRLL